MADFEILIKTEGANTAVSDIDKITKSTDKAKEAVKGHTAEVEKHVHVNRRWVTGLHELTKEVPILGYLIHSLHNPITVLGLAGAAAFEAIKHHMEEARASQEAWNGSAEKLKESVGTYSDLKKGTDQLKESQDALAKSTSSANAALQAQSDLLAEMIEQQIKSLEAQKEQEAAKIEAFETDPIKKAQKLRDNEANFGARIGAMRGSLPGQQAQLIDQQLAREKSLQEEAAATVPDEAGLRERVAQAEEDRRETEEARRDNRKKKQRSELLRMAGEPNARIEDFTPGQQAALREEGIINDVRDGEFIRPAIDTGLAGARAPAAAAESRNAADRVARARSRLRAGLGALPGGVATEADIPGFMSAAESGAARTENESFARQQALQAQKDRLLRQQQGTVGVDRINRQTAGIKGDASISKAVTDADAKEKEEREKILQSLDAKHVAEIDWLKSMRDRLDQMENQIRNNK